MPKIRKTPMRHCTGCGAELPKNEMLRVVRSPEGDIFIDGTGKSSGRGAYICKKTACLQKAQRTGRLSRSLQTQISDEIFAQLQEQIKENEQ